MKPQKTFRKVMLLALTLAVLVGMLATSVAAETATSAIPGAPASAYNMLNGGVTFETYKSDYVGTNPDFMYMYDVTGMYLTDRYANEPRTTGLSVVDVDTTDAGVDYELMLTDTLYYLGAYTSSSATSPNADKYAKSQALLDLLFSTGGPQKFSLSMEMTFHGDTGTKTNVDSSSDSYADTDAYLESYYRGTSAIAFNGTWLFKATSANLPLYTVDKDSAVTAGGSTFYKYKAGTAIRENSADMGYLYASDDTIGIWTDGADDYNFLPSDKGTDAAAYEAYGHTGACIDPDYMAGDEAVMYKLGKPVKLRFEFDKTVTAGKVTIKVYADDNLLNTCTNLTIGNSAMSQGLRFFDKKGNASIDNISVAITDCGGNHDSAWVKCTTSMTDVEYSNDVVSTHITKTCETCSETYYDAYTNPVFVSQLKTQSSGDISGSDVTGASADKDTNMSGYYFFKNGTLGVDYVDEVYDGDGNPLMMSFSLTVDDLPDDDTIGTGGKSLLTWIPNDEASSFYQFMRLFPGGEIRMVRANSRWVASNTSSAFRLEEKKTYDIDIIWEPDTGAYQLYFDGNFFGQSVCAELKSYQIDETLPSHPRLRVGDMNAGAYTVSDLVVTEAVTAANHAHSYVLFDGEKTVASHDSTLTCAYTCYCGEEAVSGINGVVVDNLYNAYADTAAISGLPTEGDFWISTEYNVRNAEAVTGESDILKIGNTLLINNNAAITDVTTEKYVVRVCYTGENTANVEIYRNGELVGEPASVTFEGDASVLTLGDADVSGVRFNDTKIVTLGHTNTPVVPNYRDARLEPCCHYKYDKEDISFYYGDTYQNNDNKHKHLYRAYSCTGCGEIITELVNNLLDSTLLEFNEELTDGNTITFGTGGYAGNKPVRSDYATIGEESEPYWVEFTFKATAINGATMANISKDTGKMGGRTLFGGHRQYYKPGATAATHAYQHMLRLFPIVDSTTESGYSANSAEIRVGSDATKNLVTTVTAGATYHLTLYVEPTTGDIDVYVDGELRVDGANVGTFGLITEENIKEGSSIFYQFRFFDTVAGVFEISDFAFYQEIEHEHVHSDDWAGASSTITYTDTTLSRTYDCYCGETGLVAEIDSVVIDRLYDAYQDTATVKEIPTEGDFWVTTDYNVWAGNNITDESAILSIGNTALIKNAGTQSSASIKSYAVYVDYTDFANGKANVAVYCEGELVEELEGVTLDGDRTALTLGDANVSGVRFFNTKIVTLGAVETPVVPTFKTAGLVACYHDPGEYIDVSSIEKQGDGLVYPTTCVKCGEAIKYPVTQYTGKPTDDAWEFREDGSLEFSGAKTYDLPSELVGADVGAYQVDFKLMLQTMKTPSTLANTHSTEGYDQGRSIFKIGTNANAVLRAFPIKDATVDGVYKTDQIDIRTRNKETTAYTIAAGMTVGEEGAVDFSLILNPTENSVIFYVNDEYVYKRTDGVFTSKTLSTIMFGDGNQCTFVLSDLTFYKFGEQEHVHTDKWAPETTISVTENTLSRTYTCYCGETVTADIENVVIDNLDDGYQDSAVITGLPTSGEFWIVTDYNVRSSNVITSDKLNSAIVSVGDTAILENTEVITFPVITGYALRVEYINVEKGEANVTVFCNGKQVGDTAEVILAGDTSVLTLGDGAVSDVRFLNTKVVTLGEVETAAVPTFTAAGLMPCNHNAFNQSNFTFVYGDDFEDAESEYRKLYKSYTCSGCGETLTEQVDNMFNEVVASDSKGSGMNTSLKDGGTVTGIVGNKNVIADNTIGKANDPFWIRFTVDVTSITQANVESVYWANSTTVQTSGRTFFGTYHNTSAYQHLLRSFAVANEDYDSTVEGSLPYRTDITQLRIGNKNSGALNPTGAFVTYLEAGKTYDFSLYFVPQTGDLDVYLNGKFQASGNVGTMTEDTTKWYGFRFLDANSGTYNFGNFYMYRDSTYDAHEHSDEWDITSSGKGVLLTDTKLSPYYTCYCGEKVFYGEISELVNDKIADIYNGLGNITLGKADAGTWISSDINIRESVVDGSLITLGENSLLSIENGKLVSGTTDTGITVSENSSYVTAVKLVSASSYELYVNGKFAASGELTNASTDLTLGDESFGENVRFRYNKVVKIDDDDTTDVLVPSYDHGDVINSCYHKANGNAEDRTVSLEGEVLKYTYVCSKCGERVYTALNDDLLDKATAGTESPLSADDLKSVQLSGSEFLYVENGVLLDGADPYWLTFDMTPNTIPSTTRGNTGEASSANERTYKGYGVITIQPTGVFTSELRLIMDGWEEENAIKDSAGYMTRGKTDGVVELKVLHTDIGSTTFRYAPTAVYLKKDEAVSIALRVDPSTGIYDVYVNGVYIVSANRGVATTESSNPRIRFHESGTFTYSNIKLMSYVHECVYDQETIDDKYIAVPANCAEPAKYYKSCVCGEFVDTAETFDGVELDLENHLCNMEVTEFKFLKSKATHTAKAVYYKSCGCGELGDETFEYGEIIAECSFDQMIVDAKYAVEGEADTYYKSCSVCGEASDTETFVATVPTVTFGDYELETNVTLDGKITVIEMNAKFTPVGTAVMYLPLVKVVGTESEELELLYVEASTGTLAIKLADGSYSAFYGAADQEVITLNETEDASIAIVYDDADGLIRYYVDRYLPYYYENGARLANDVVPYGCDTFKDAVASSVKMIAASDDVAATADISRTYNINDSGTAEILALQEHTTVNGVRVIAGIDMLWYASVGFEIQVYDGTEGQGVKTVYTNQAFESIKADGEQVFASMFSDYEFNYFAAITVTDVKIEEGHTYYMIMTPFTGVGDKIYRGESVKINVTADSYEFATEEAGE